MYPAMMYITTKIWDLKETVVYYSYHSWDGAGDKQSCWTVPERFFVESIYD